MLAVAMPERNDASSWKVMSTQFGISSTLGSVPGANPMDPKPCWSNLLQRKMYAERTRGSSNCCATSPEAGITKVAPGSRSRAMHMFAKAYFGAGNRTVMVALTIGLPNGEFAESQTQEKSLTVNICITIPTEDVVIVITIRLSSKKD